MSFKIGRNSAKKKVRALIFGMAVFGSNSGSAADSLRFLNLYNTS